MDIGRLNKRVEFGAITLDTNEYGEPIETFTSKFKAWANIKHVSGRELIQAGAIVNQTVITIVCRYNEDLKLTNKVKYNGSTWGISTIAPDERNDFMNVTAEMTQ